MSKQPIRHIVVTGGSGYIGARLVMRALAQGYDVTVLGRGNSAPSAARARPWQLGDALPQLDLPGEMTAIVHLAHDWRDHDTQGVNARGTERLLEGARAQKIGRFVYVSSQSARADACNAYGRIKWATERLLAGRDAVSARVGLVYGSPRRGMFGLLARLVSATPVLPMVNPSRLVQPIHIDEVCRGLLALANSDIAGWVGLAAPDPMRFEDFLKILGQEGFAFALVILPIPLRLALFAAAASAWIPVGPTIDRERILGLAGTVPMECRDHLAKIGLSVQPLRQGLRHDPLGRKGQLMEGHILCQYVLGRRPSSGLVRRVARALRLVEEDAAPSALPWLSRWVPGLIRFIDPIDRSSRFARRLRVATALSEFSKDGFVAIFKTRLSSRLLGIGAIIAITAVEIVIFPLRLLLGRR